ncbi:alpha/beta hydrolase fold domain-containing protein [Pseudoroseomonas globiformis]|uniref:Alpha/beta hydrolase fold domain-containing protein n=1 Tax=Teichococcus globiformis TaxID=2307229 RepID=A0ABV7G2X9_9PROT
MHYRRAPEKPYPAPTEDASAALCWVAEPADALEIGSARPAIAGDSAGGNLALSG